MSETIMFHLIPEDAAGSDKAAARAAFRNAAQSALRIPQVETAVMYFKARLAPNGHPTRCGHKVGDNIKATEELIDKSPAVFQKDLTSSVLTIFEKSQLLDVVLRKFWIVDKFGKVDGTPNPKYLARQDQAESQDAATDGAAAAE